MNPYAEAAADLASTQPKNRYASAAADLAQTQDTQIRSNVIGMGGVAPHQAASAARLSKQTGLPLDLVQRNMPAVQQRLTAERIDADTASSPVLRSRYADASFAALAQDDSAALSRLESQSYTFGNALRKGAAGAKLTWDFLADRMAGAFGADKSETQRILKDTAGFYSAQGADPQLQAAGERAKAAGGGTWYGTLLNLPGEVLAEENPVQVLGKFMTEQLPASLAGFGIGAAATAPARAAIVSRVSSQLVAKGVNMSLAGAAGNSTAVVTQSLGTNYQEGIGQGLSPDEAASRAWTKTLAEVPANAIAGAALGLRIGRSQLTNILSQTAIQGAGGGTGAAMASRSVGETPDPVEIALEILGEGVSAGPEIAGLSFSKIASSRAVQQAEAAAAATDGAAQLGAMATAANASALKGRDPQAFAEFVAELQPDARVYIAPEHLEGVDLSAVPGLAARAAEAAATGGDVQLSVADLLAHLPADKVLPNVRLQPEAMTAAEAQQFNGMQALSEEMTVPKPPAGAMIDAPTAGMDEQGWADLQAAGQDAAQAAVEEREARGLRDMEWLARRKTEAAAQIEQQALAARSVIASEVQAQVQQQPAYAVQRWLKTGALPDGTQSVGAKLSTKALREMYGEGPAAPWRYIASNMLGATEGMHPDVVAEMFGFESGDDMVRAMVSAEPESAVVDRIADERLADEHPDIADAIARERSAEAVVFGKARERFLAAEAAALARAVGNRVLLGQEARRYAEASLARLTVRDIRPAQFRAAAARAEQASATAFRKGDTALAAKWKQSQVLQTVLESRAEAAQGEVAQALRLFKRVIRADDTGRDANLAATARAVLAEYGLGASDKTAADYLDQVKRYDPELHADLLQLIEGMPAGTADHRDLTLADFRSMHERVDALWSLARSTRVIEIDGQRVELEHAASEMAALLAQEPAAKREQIVGTNERLDVRMRLAGVRAALRRVEFWADARDGGDSSGPFRRFIWQPVAEAVTKYRRARNEYVSRFLTLLKTVEPTLKPGKIAAPELRDGMVFADRSALLHALLHTGNESNRRKLLLGYDWATQNEDGTLDSSRWDKFLARMTREGRITKADWDFAQSVWDLLEETKPAAQAAHKRMFGTYFEEVTADPVQTPWGEYRGGYVPALTDPLLVSESRTHGAMDDMLASQNSPMFPAVNRGFTKSRVENYTRPLALDLRLMPAHLDKVLRFSEMGPALRDAARLVTRNATFREAMNAVDPAAIESMLVPWLKRTAAQTLTKAPETQADRAVARIANKVRQRTGLLLMAGNVVNTLQQVTGLSVAALRVAPRHLAAGMVDLIKAPTQAGRSIDELSEWMQQRGDSSARDVERAIENLLTNPGGLARAEQFGNRYGYALQQAMQNLLDRVVWLGAFKQAAAEGVTGVDQVRAADSAVRMTQSSFAPEDASKVEHAGAFTRLFLQFASYFNGQMNLLATEGHNAKSSGRLALVYLLGFAVPAFVADVISKGMRGDLDGDDEDGDELAAKMLEVFMLSQARYALAMVPVAGQVGNAALGQFTPERFDDRIGASPAYSALEATVRAPFSIARAANDEGSTRLAVRDGLTAVGVLTGLPTGVLVRPLGYLADDERDGVEARGLLTGSTPK